MTSLSLRAFVAALCLLAIPFAGGSLARAEGAGVVAIVNDVAITEYDISQRLALMKILGDTRDADNRKKALHSLIDETVKINEAQKLKMAPSDADVRKQIERMATNMKTDTNGLAAKLKGAGISMTALERFVTASMGFSRIINAKHRADIEIKPADVDRKMAEVQRDIDTRIKQVMNDPRMKGVTVYSLLQIDLPLDGNDDMAQQLMQARAVEAMQIIQKFKGCKSARKSADGIFNVKIGKQVEADASKLPPKLKEFLDKAGVGRAVGPIPTKKGIQIIALCSVRKITPPKPKAQMPTRDQVENLLFDEKFSAFEEEYLKEARKRVYVEYKSAEYSQ